VNHPENLINGGLPFNGFSVNASDNETPNRGLTVRVDERSVTSAGVVGPRKFQEPAQGINFVLK
jgi:hypothetical protein